MLWFTAIMRRPAPGPISAATAAATTRAPSEACWPSEAEAVGGCSEEGSADTSAEEGRRRR